MPQAGPSHVILGPQAATVWDRTTGQVVARGRPRPNGRPDWRRESEVKSRFLNMAAHELNTPLTPMRLQMHLLTSGAFGKVTARHAKALRVVARNLDRLQALVQEILDVARMEGGGLRTRATVVDLDAAIEEAVASYEETAQRLGVRLRIQRKTGLQIESDRGRLLQILHNLVSNAVKFTPRGGRVEVVAEGLGHVGPDAPPSGRQARSGPKGGNGDKGGNADKGREPEAKAGGGPPGPRFASISVRDSGAGLSVAQASALFKPFSRPHETTLPDTGGTGLGLFISLGLAEAMGGSLSATSPGPGLGSTFTLVLPTSASHVGDRPPPTGAPHEEDAVAQRLREII